MLNRAKTAQNQNVTESRKNAAFCFQNVTTPLSLRFPSAFAPLSEILLCLYR